jgi:hypothetical protein
MDENIIIAGIEKMKAAGWDQRRIEAAVNKFIQNSTEENPGGEDKYIPKTEQEKANYTKQIRDLLFNILTPISTENFYKKHKGDIEDVLNFQKNILFKKNYSSMLEKFQNPYSTPSRNLVIEGASPSDKPINRKNLVVLKDPNNIRNNIVINIPVLQSQIEAAKKYNIPPEIMVGVALREKDFNYDPPSSAFNNWRKQDRFTESISELGLSPEELTKYIQNPNDFISKYPTVYDTIPYGEEAKSIAEAFHNKKLLFQTPEHPELGGIRKYNFGDPDYPKDLLKDIEVLKTNSEIWNILYPQPKNKITIK